VPLPPDFASSAALRTAFVSGLRQMLEDEEGEDGGGLGGVILVLANAGFDPAIWRELEPLLRQRYDRLAERCRRALRAGRTLAGPEDDVAVFLKLLVIGFEHLRPTEFRPAGPWELQFNPLRALRPARMSGQRPGGIRRPFDPAGFHFNRPFLQRELLWAGRLLSHEAALFYNKFPFAPLHGLLVPEPARELPQFLTQEMHHYAWHLSETLGRTLPGVGLAYNSCGAHASVNHLHFQTFVRPAPLPVEAARWTHNGGAEAYPAACRVFGSTLEAWFFLDGLHQTETPYNLIYLPGRLYCLPRRPQGSFRHAPWAGGHAWYELAGGVISCNRDDFEGLDPAAIESELRLTGGE